MSIDPNVGKAFDAITTLQSNIEKVAQLKNSGELTVVDGKAKVVKQSFFGKIWSTLRRTKPDPVPNSKGLEVMLNESAENLISLREILNDKSAPEELKGQIRNSLTSVLKEYSPEALKEYESRMEAQLVKSAKAASVNLDTLRDDFSEGRIDSIPDKFEGAAKSKMIRLVRFMHVAGPAARVSSLPEVKALVGNRQGSEVSKLGLLLTNAFKIATSKGPLIPFARTVERPATSPTIMGAQVSQPPTSGVAPPPPPAMSPEKAQELAKVNKAKEAAVKKAEAEKKRKAAISEVKVEQKNLEKEIGKIEKQLKVMSGRSKGLMTTIRQMRTGIDQLMKRGNANDDFRLYESSLRKLDDSKKSKMHAESELKAFKKENTGRASMLQKFLASGKEKMTISVLRSVQNPDTKQEEFVDGEAELTRARAKQLLTEYETPLKELTDSFASATGSLEKFQSNIDTLKNKQIDGQSFRVFVKNYQSRVKAFEGLEADLHHVNGEKFALQDTLKARKEQRNVLETKLARLEKRTPEIKVSSQKGLDPNEITKKLRSGAGPLHLRDIKLKGRVTVQKKMDDSENVDPNKETSVFRRSLGKKDIS